MSVYSSVCLDMGFSQRHNHFFQSWGFNLLVWGITALLRRKNRKVGYTQFGAVCYPTIPPPKSYVKVGGPDPPDRPDPQWLRPRIFEICERTDAIVRTCTEASLSLRRRLIRNYLHRTLPRFPQSAPAHVPLPFSLLNGPPTEIKVCVPPSGEQKYENSGGDRRSACHAFEVSISVRPSS